MTLPTTADEDGMKAVEAAPVDDIADLADPSAVIFDLDGTLVDTVEARIRSWLDTFEEVGIRAERNHVAGLIGADGKRLAHEVAAVADRTLSEDKAEAMDKRAGQRFDELNREPLPLPGAIDLLQALAGSDLPWAIATSSRAEQTGRSVAALALGETDPHVIDGSSVAHAKPAPDLLLLAGERLSVPMHSTWYVGDATWDMRAAKAANMVGVAIASGAATEAMLRAAGARVVVSSLEALRKDLRRRRLVAAS